MLATEGREENSVFVWVEKSLGKWSISSYMRRTKSKGLKIILLLSNDRVLPTMGITKDDGFKKSSLNKVYDYKPVLTLQVIFSEVYLIVVKGIHKNFYTNAR